MIALTGASGQLGRLVLNQLLHEVEAARVVALTRTPDCLSPCPVSTRFADFDDADSLAPAFEGVERLLLISTGVFDPPGRRVRQHTNAVRAAARAGVGHLVYTSIGRADDPAHPAAVAADHRLTEAALAGSGVAYTVLRNSIYTQLALVGLDVMLATGLLLDNTGDGAISYVTREDCAAVAATVLARGGYQGQALEVTGPEALTVAEIAALISEVTRVTVRYVPISDEMTVTGLVAHGMPERTARRFATIGVSVREGFTGLVADTVERVTGCRSTSVADYLATRRATLARRSGR